MMFRRAIVALPLVPLLAACAAIAGLDTNYDGPRGTGVDPADATVPHDSSYDGARDVELTDATADSAAEACIPANCASLGANCGSSIPDGCGNLIATCGACDAATTCGAAGQNKCGKGPCDASACTPDQCDMVSDGCGGQHQCPTQCSAPMLCTGGGCGGCVKDGTMCKNDENTWPAWLCDDKGLSRGGGCNLVQYVFDGKAYYCCPPP
jgi:hypothetical protein